MKTIFEKEIIDDFVNRINKVNSQSRPLWGKMNSFQMLKHCSECTKSNLGERTDKRPFISYIFGRMTLNKIVKDDKPVGINSPTFAGFVIKENGDVEHQKKQLISLVKKYATRDVSSFEGTVHPFFGKMTAHEIGILDYKHLDHHLRQFGV